MLPQGGDTGSNHEGRTLTLGCKDSAQRDKSEQAFERTNELSIHLSIHSGTLRPTGWTRRIEDGHGGFDAATRGLPAAARPRRP